MAKGEIIVSRLDGTRVTSLPGMSNVVNEGDSVWVNIFNATPNADMKIKFGSYTDWLRTNQYGNGQELISLREPGNIGINVIDSAQNHTFFAAVWVQAKAPPQQGTTTPSGSQQQGGSTTPTQQNQQQGTTTPSGSQQQQQGGGTTVITVTETPKNAIVEKAQEIEDWFRRNLIPVLFIAISLIMVAVFAGTKAGRKAVQTLAKGAPIKR